jgi:hypothetical protein
MKGMAHRLHDNVIKMLSPNAFEIMNRPGPGPAMSIESTMEVRAVVTPNYAIVSRSQTSS